MTRGNLPDPYEGLDAVRVAGSNGDSDHLLLQRSEIHARALDAIELEAKRGCLVRFDASDYHQLNDGNSSFRRFDAEVQQFVPLLNENWVIALRAAGRASTISATSLSAATWISW